MKIFRIGCVLGGFLSLALSLGAQTFTTVYNFQGNPSAAPAAALVQATNGNFYGSTSDVCGTIFEMTPAGKFTTLYSFPITVYYDGVQGPDGCSSIAPLVQGANGNFYGTTSSGGTYNHGTVFEITPAGKLTMLHSFCAAQTENNACSDGSSPRGGLVLGSDGNFYGTTSTGYIAYGPSGGTVFKMTPAGVLTTLYTFCSVSESGASCADGNGPYAGLVQGRDGNFYGTTVTGGSSGSGGTVFKVTPGGQLTTLYSFCQHLANYQCTDGSSPEAPLVQGSDGNFYGTTSDGGPSNSYGYTYGTVFKITPEGALTVLHGFEGPDGAAPLASLIQGSDGNLYGTTSYGGSNNPGGGAGYPYGTVFQITPGGTLTTLYSFCSSLDDGICMDGNYAAGALLQATNGIFYGTTGAGGDGTYCYGPGNCPFTNPGTVFSASTGLGSFVETQTSSGKVGATVKILGTKLTGATSVMFDGTPAIFKVVSSSEITSTVPAGAGTGLVTVTTPSATLTSNRPFLVTPKVTSFTPASGVVGTSVTITGVSLTQTTAVTFGGVPAIIFSVVSDTEVTATVPSGAASGDIAITTAGGTATGAKSFKVTP